MTLILLWKISCAKFLLWYFRSISWLFENSGRNACISWDDGVPTDVGSTHKGPPRTVPSFGDFHTTPWSLSKRSKAPRSFKIKLACECLETPACRSSCLQELDSSRICGLSLSPGRRRQWEQTTEGEGPTSHVLPWGPVFFLCLYGWCPAMEKTKSMLLWFFYLPLSEPVQVKATSHLCGPHADHFFYCTPCSLLLNWTLYHYLMTFVFFSSFWFHVCVIRCLCDVLHLLPALRAWTYCLSFCSYTLFRWHEPLPSIWYWVLCFFI